MTRSFDERLRADLVAAARRRVPARRRRGLRAGVAALATAATGALVATTVSPAGADVDVTVRDGVLEVRITDLETRPQVIAEALADAGLDVEVSAVPVGPSNVGHFVGSAGTAIPPELEPLDGSPTSFTGFAIPADYDGRLVLRVGRPAGDGEAYRATSDAYAPGEPMSCRGLYGEPATEVADALAADGVEVTFRPFADGVPATPAVVAGTEVAGSPFADWSAVDAGALAPDAVDVVITPDGRSPFPVPPSPDGGACRE